MQPCMFSKGRRELIIVIITQTNKKPTDQLYINWSAKHTNILKCDIKTMEPAAAAAAAAATFS